MKREEFVFSVGFVGEESVVDKAMIKEYANLDTAALLEKGFFRAAFCSALWAKEVDNNDSDVAKVLAVACQTYGNQFQEIEDLMRLFGVFKIPEGTIKVKAL